MLGEEGCAARWVLVVTGQQRGFVWLTTGEGATPTGMTFRPWLEKLSTEGEDWWPELVMHWGSEPGTWFYSHVAKKACVLILEEREAPSPQIQQSVPLCFDCIAFLAKEAEYRATQIEVFTPESTWTFSADGEVHCRGVRGGI